MLVAIIGNMRNKSLLPIDELNVFEEYLKKIFDGQIELEDPSEIEDTLEDLLVLAYVYGTDAANEDLRTDIKPNIDKMNESLNKPIADKTWKQRLNEYLDRPDKSIIEEIIRIADTESHRIYNEALFNTALESGLPVKKRWVTMHDLLVRDAHDLLEGVSVRLDERFYTDGDSALVPGGFERADNNINCRCELILSSDEMS